MVIGDGRAGIRRLTFTVGDVVELRVQSPAWHETPVGPHIDMMPGCVACILIRSFIN